MINKIRILCSNLNLIKEDLENNKPYEACGVLIGIIKDSTAEIEKVIPINNVKRTEKSFELDPMQFYDAWDNAQKIDMEVVGVYHTHPFYSPVPSLWDRETMENTNIVCLIAGAYGMRAYIWSNGIKIVRIIEY